jgi:hypothetical protein
MRGKETERWGGEKERSGEKKKENRRKRERGRKKKRRKGKKEKGKEEKKEKGGEKKEWGHYRLFIVLSTSHREEKLFCQTFSQNGFSSTEESAPPAQP